MKMTFMHRDSCFSCIVFIKAESSSPMRYTFSKLNFQLVKSKYANNYIYEHYKIYSRNQNALYLRMHYLFRRQSRRRLRFVNVINFLPFRLRPLPPYILVIIPMNV